MGMLFPFITPPAASRLRHLSSAAAARAAAPAVNAADPLLQPFKLTPHLTLRNRILSTSHAPNYVEDKLPQRRYRLYQTEKAKGGVALSMFGGSSTVSPDSPAAFGQIDVSTDAVIPHFQRLADKMHLNGAATMCQLTHMGRRTSWDVADWLPTVAPSRVREHAHRSFPKELEPADLRRIAADFGNAAWRCQQGGLDGVELLASGHLLDSFWSPLTNQRTDGYGGSLENRVRFVLEVLESIRERCGEQFAVGIRMVGESASNNNGSGAAPGALTHDDGLRIAELLARSKLVDFLNVNVGNIDTENRLASHIPSMYGPLAPQLEVVAPFRQFGLPVFHACNIKDITTARRAIRDGLIDMVGMTRAHIADPHLVNKLSEGREEDIRPCVGAGYCLDRIYIGLDALCLHNPATGREHLGMPHVITPAPHAAVGAAVTSAISEPQAMPVLRRRQAAHQRQAQRHEQSHADGRMPPERSRPSPVSVLEPLASSLYDVRAPATESSVFLSRPVPSVL